MEWILELPMKDRVLFAVGLVVSMVAISFIVRNMGKVLGFVGIIAGLSVTAYALFGHEKVRGAVENVWAILEKIVA